MLESLSDCVLKHEVRVPELLRVGELISVFILILFKENNMSFIPLELTVQQILEGDRIYKIPNFQRNFSWENNNFIDFFEDLIKSGEFDVKNNEISKNKYFFGMILLLGDKDPNVSMPYEVIDGQQRLTTITLFYAAIKAIIEELMPDYKTDFDNRLFLTYTSNGEKKEIQRLLNDKLNPAFPVNILNLNNKRNYGATANADSSEQVWLMESYEYIKNIILSKKNIQDTLSKMYSKDINELSTKKYVLFLDKFGKYLSKSTIICIFHENRSAAHVLFRNLNYRGKPLSQPDLIKNEIFSLLEDSDQYASKKWSTVEDNIYRVHEQLQKFLYHYMYGRYVGTTNKNIFSKFMNNIDNNRRSYTEFLESLVKSSFYYKTMIIPEENSNLFNEENYFKKDNNPSIKRNLEFLNKIDVSQCRILLISLFESREKNKISNKIFSAFIKTIARHQCIHVMVKSSANKLNAIYFNTSKKILQLQESAYNDANDILNEFRNELKNKLPDIKQVRDVDLEYTAKKKSEGMKTNEIKEHAIIRFILSTIAENVQIEDDNRGNDGLKFIYDSTIEHIIDKENKFDNVNSLGNLILLEGNIHTNDKDKIKMYDKSIITMTKNFHTNYPDFEYNKIKGRKNNLIKKFYDIVK